MVSFEVGDIVRVRAARRRDVPFTVTQVTPSVVVAVNDRGECRYSPESFERVDLTANDAPAASESQASVGGPWPLRDAPPASNPPAAFYDSTIVQVNVGEPSDFAIRRFKKAVQRSGVLQDARRHEHFIPKSRRRREKSLRARKRRA